MQIHKLPKAQRQVADSEGRSPLHERVNSLLPNPSAASPLLLQRNGSARTSLNQTPFSPRRNWRNPVLDDLQAHLERLSP